MATLTLDEAKRLLESPDAFEKLAGRLDPDAIERDPVSATALLLKLASCKQRDVRWTDVLLATLRHDRLRGSVLYANRDKSMTTRDAYAEELARSDNAEVALALAMLGDARGLPRILRILDHPEPNTTSFAVFHALEHLVDATAVEPLTRWLAAHPNDAYVANAKTLLARAKAIASGKPPKPPKPPRFDAFVTKLVAEGKRAAKAFQRANPNVTVSSFAFDASPGDEYFAGCFDDASRPDAAEETTVGNFSHHLFHEFSLPVASKLPKGPLPPSPSVADGYVEHFFRPVLERACQELATSGSLDSIRALGSLRVGYAYHDSVFVICAVLPAHGA